MPGVVPGAARNEAWWTRTRSIRTAGELLFEVALVRLDPPPVYQRIAERARALQDRGLSRHRTARELGVADKTVARAMAWLGRDTGGG